MLWGTLLLGQLKAKSITMLNTQKAATLTLGYLSCCGNQLPEHSDAYGEDHLEQMLIDLISGKVAGEKAHRWLGWVQCAIVIFGGCALQDMKAVNIEAFEE